VQPIPNRLNGEGLRSFRIRLRSSLVHSDGRRSVLDEFTIRWKTRAWSSSSNGVHVQVSSNINTPADKRENVKMRVT
jgi:hypothetical protein